jgi:phosphatidylserine/phosphatidylglycerophosphate/cardiolipin synthase-like enzyme
MSTRPIDAELLIGRALYDRVVREHLEKARESVWIATANVKDMHVEREDGVFVSILDVFSELASRGVELRLLHADLPSRPFRARFDRKKRLVAGGLELKICPRVHLKAVLVDGGWLYLGSANLTGAGLGAKADGRRNFELGFATEDFETIDRLTALFESIWSGAECRTCLLFKECPDPIGEPPASRRRRKAKRDGIRLGHTRRIVLPGR